MTKNKKFIFENSRGKVEVALRKIGELKTYEQNAKPYPKSQIEKLAKSISKFGFVNPVILTKNDLIIAGHGRVEAINETDNSEIITLKLMYMDDSEARELRVADNQINLLTGFDMDLLKEELQAIKLDTEDVDFEAMGFGDWELEALIGDEEFSFGDDEDEQPEDLDEEAIGTQKGKGFVLYLNFKTLDDLNAVLERLGKNPLKGTKRTRVLEAKKLLERIEWI